MSSRLPSPTAPKPPEQKFVCKKGHTYRSRYSWPLIMFFHPCEECGGEMRPEGSSFDTRFPVSYDIFNSTQKAANP